MKIHIIFKFQDGPYGGGNQFLKALREAFRESDSYAERPEDADVFLFNSFQDIRAVLQMKRRFPGKPFVHRVDGPISLYRNNSSDSIDRLIFSLNDAIADATIFQSRFSLEENQKLGIPKKKFEMVIHNAPDSSIFFAKETIADLHRKIRLISISWSSNPMKGFDTYEYLDKHLDFSKYEYLFIGNSPISFKNIKMLPPQPSNIIAKLLRDSDIYITASKKDPCSNSLIEALSCGIPVLAIHDGGHPELVQHGGETFITPEEIPKKLEKISLSYNSYKKQIPLYTIQSVSGKYLSLFQKVKDDGHTKKRSLAKIAYILSLSAVYRIRESL